MRPTDKTDGITPLARLAPDFWFQDRANSTFWLRLYSSLGVSHEDFLTLTAQVVRPLQVSPGVACWYGQWSNYKYLKFHSFLYTNEAGMTVVEMKLDSHPLPNANYIALLTPLQIDGVPGNETAAKQHLDHVAALLCAHAGTNLLHSLVMEGAVNAENSNLTVASQGLEMPKPCDGPFLNVQNWTDTNDLLTAIASASTDKSRRIQLALNFLARAMWHREPFFFYWCALEILCGGHSGRIAEKLRACYGLRNHAQAQDATGFRTLRKMRDRFFHLGEQVHLTQDVERYVQLLFLDLLRAELSLNPHYHAVALQRSPHFDLTQIGLPRFKSKA